jgi:RNA polymerase sigma-70 factor (ECF subfamily)
MQDTQLPAALAPTDAELVGRARQGSEEAFSLLMRRNNRRLYRLARSILKDEGEAEEAVQEGYLRAFTHFEGFKGDATVGAWLARIVVNEALGRLRQRRPTVDLSAVADKLTASGGVPISLAGGSPEQTAARREIGRLIERAVDDLPPAFRATFMMRTVEQLSIAETAACLGIPEETVKSRLHRANRQLREALRGELSSLIDDVFPFAGARCDGLMQRVLARLAGRLVPGLPASDPDRTAPADSPSGRLDNQEKPS